MIPTMILLGLVAGRWWKTVIALGALLWTLLILLTGTDIDGSVLVSAFLLGGANTAVGVMAHQALRHGWRLLHQRHGRPVGTS